ncbi:hypothetical protein HPB48_004454 [Haemaphysalis longicornis]|uniref:Tick transposon n=1 Tax=Haemaphysalis longicornis TaxID=44386 RepID=A0A9J6H1D5_HAELO|nr:hypothetical protein HPB48_004454 [Haemaphysalis longicornis]
MKAEGAEQLRDMIAENRSLNRIDLSAVRTPLSPECIGILSRGVTQNPFIISFNTNNVHKDADQTVLNAAVMGNCVCLNRAVRFALRRNKERMCAEALKQFQAQPVLIEHVKKESGKSDKKAKVAVMSAASQVDRCGVDHEETFIPCATGVVYKVPVTCGLAYIGQTGRCVNLRLKEHQLRGRMSQHRCSDGSNGGDCKPLFQRTEILASHIDRLTRETIETYYIEKHGEKCISSVFSGTLSQRRRATQLQ